MRSDTPPRPAVAPPYRRREQTRRWGTVLLMLGVAWLVFELTSRGAIFGLSLGFVERSAAMPPQSFSAARLVLHGTVDTVELVSWPGDTITIEAVKHGFGWNAAAAADSLGRIDLLARRDRDTLLVDVQRQSALGALGRAPYLDLRISLPAGVAFDVSTVSGDIQAHGLRADGALATVSGQIRLSDSSGAFRLSTTSGDIALTGTSGRVYLRSISGSFTLADLRDAQLDLESTSGDVEADGGLAAGTSSQISSISGSVRVGLANPADLRLQASTTSGTLSSDLDLRAAQRERRQLSGVLGTGSTVLTVFTTSGDVEVNGD
jgi:hypothetical protein